MLKYDRSIIKALKSMPSATESLRQVFVRKGYLHPTDTPTAEQLVTFVLKRIELSADHYKEFIAMLCDIKGMELTVKILTSMTYNLLCLFLLALGGQTV